MRKEIDKDEVIEKLTTDHILTLMAELGEHPYKTDKQKQEIWFKTICHGGDYDKKSHKLCYFEKTKTFYCYTECGFMDVIGFICTTMNLDYYKALVLLSEKVGINTRAGFGKRNNSQFYRDLRQIDEYINMRTKKAKKTEQSVLPSIDTNILNYFEDDIFYEGWIDEGISIDSMKKYKIMWYELHKAIIIPHFDVKGNLVGVRRRSLLAEHSKNKYMPLQLNEMMYSHSLNFNFYGLYENREAIKRLKKVCIIEGEKSVLLADTFYGDNNFTVATCGFNISNWHRDILLELGVEEVIIGFDKDFMPEECDDETHPDYTKYLAYKRRIAHLANKFTPYFRTYIIWDNFGKLELKDSPFDQGQETLEFLMKNKIQISTDDEEG